MKKVLKQANIFDFLQTIDPNGAKHVQTTCGVDNARDIGCSTKECFVEHGGIPAQVQPTTVLGSGWQHGGRCFSTFVAVFKGGGDEGRGGGGEGGGGEGGGGEGEGGGGDGVGGKSGGGLGAGWLGGGEGGIGGSEGGGIGGKMGWDTSTDKAPVGRLRSVETVARTSSADRLPLTKVCASFTPPTVVTESTSATPRKATPVIATPAPTRSGISAVRLPLVSERASTAVPVPPESCNARRSLGPECSAQSGELAWHASRSFAASRLASASGGTA